MIRADAALDGAGKLPLGQGDYVRVGGGVIVSCRWLSRSYRAMSRSLASRR